MPTDLNFACRCGAVAGTLRDVVPKNLCHLICYCADCRAFARHMGRLDDLEPGGGSPLVQVLPARIDIGQGADQIACLRLSDKGLHRWSAKCCNTPLANTPGTSKVPLAGMWRPLFADMAAFGPVTTHGFTKMARPGQGGPKRDKGLLRMLGGLASRSIAAYMAGNARQSPFFAADGAPVAVPQVLDAQARRAAYVE